MSERTLVIMRHGKADQAVTRGDAARQLIERGRADARLGGAWLAAQGLHPDVVLCSAAARTRGTWHEVAIGLVEADVTASPNVSYDASLYDGGLGAALELIRGVDPGAGTVLLIGHNPTVSGLSVRLDDARVRAAGGLRTSGIAVHRVESSWAELAVAALVAEHTPRA